jgi:flavin reductase (DIM6/NTAB) family NADH-FMN oxidoreductase RutF
VIDPALKRSLGQMMHGVHVVAARHDGEVRAFCSHWVTQVSFAEPVVMASVSPKHDTHPLMVASGEFTVSMLAGDQVEVGQYFSYPGRKFHRIAGEYLTTDDGTPGGMPVVADCIAWLRCTTFQRMDMVDHELFFARVTGFGAGRLKAPPLLYSSRLGWRVSGDRAREPGDSVRDRLLARLAAAGIEAPADDEPDEA